MKALRLKLFQETACYKKPFAFKVGETYPLPPYSTVKGMIHALLDAKEFIPMRLSVQGSYDTIIVDYQSHYFFKKVEVNELPLVLDGLSVKPDYNEMTKMPLYIHLLYNVDLLIHVEAEENILVQIIDAIESGREYLSLGRREDLVRVDDYRIVALKEKQGVLTNSSAYIPIDLLGKRTKYIPYRLNWKYEIRKGVRKWEKVNVGYLDPGVYVSGNQVYIEDTEEEYPVFFHIPGR